MFFFNEIEKMQIPKIFYQCWDNPLPSGIHDRNINCLPNDFNYKRFSLEEAALYLKEHWGTEVFNLFHKYERIPHKVDLWRYCILYDTGGVYMDADCILLNEIKPLVDSSQLFFVSNYQGIKNIFNGFLGTVPGHNIYQKMIEFMLKTGTNFQGDYYFNCNQLYIYLNECIAISPGKFDYLHDKEQITLLWDKQHEDRRFYAYLNQVPILVETNPDYPYLLVD
jgi:hypothetical protein